MNYQVIARKYRPQRFVDVVGQEHVTQTLANAITQNRIAHAYLFCGPRGTGKTTIARIFAKCLNCTGGPKVDFSDDDPRCREITEGRSLDVLEIDGASNRGIEEIRELRETVKYAPASGKFKIYIIDEVHMLTKEAFNALLKTLEEPPAHVKFMFATTEPEKVLPTILSRCQRFDLRRIPTKLITDHLKKIAREEKVKIDDEALHAIARGAEGGMRDAESALDQLISFCGNKIVEADVLSMFGLTAQGQIQSLAGAVLSGDAQQALTELDDLGRHGKDLGRLLSDLLGHFRNVLVYQVSRGDLKLLEASEDELATIKKHAPAITTGALTRVMEVLADCESRLRDAASRKIVVEIALLKAIEARQSVNIDTVLQRLNELRGSAPAATAPAATAPATAAAPVAKATPRSETAATISRPAASTVVTANVAGASDIDLENLWARLIEAVGRASPFAKTYLVEAHPVSFLKNVFTIGFDPEFADHLSLVDNAKNHGLLQTKLAELGHPNCQIKFVRAERPANRSGSVAAVTAVAASNAAPTGPAPVSAASQVAPPPPKRAGAGPTSKEDFKNDPLIQKALEVFKGQIVEVRSGF
jgi:DNA polymerase-3 subunit gamma/tau